MMGLGIKVPRALRAQVNSLLKEMQRRNRELLIQHAELIDGYSALFQEVAAYAPNPMMLSREETRDIVKCAAIRFACMDMEEGADKFIDLMHYPDSWDEKMKILRERYEEVRPKTQ